MAFGRLSGFQILANTGGVERAQVEVVRVSIGEGLPPSLPATKLLLSAFSLISFSPLCPPPSPVLSPIGPPASPSSRWQPTRGPGGRGGQLRQSRDFRRGRHRGQGTSVGLKGVEGMEIPNPVSMFDARHGDNTDVLLALLTQNKELEGEPKT